jgi:glycine cleavage system regulatory protein
MKKHAVLSVLGRDRVGIVDDLAATLKTRGIDIESSRMTVHGGQFAILATVSGEQGSVTLFGHHLDALGAELRFHLQLFEPAEEPKEAPREHDSKGGSVYIIEAFSPEPFGWSAITTILKRRKINIDELETEVSDAPCSSRLTFHMKASVRIPASCSTVKLREELGQLEVGRHLDILIKPGPSHQLSVEGARSG